MQQRRNILVTGGAGMLGLETVRQFMERGDSVRVFDLVEVRHPNLDTVVGDIRNKAAVEEACRGMDVVIHAAAAVWSPSVPYHNYESVNVEGTQNVIEACRRARVPRLVFTSTMDVVVDGRNPIVDGDESLPYPRRLPKEPYSRSKILAEKMVASANSPDFGTCILRPAGMYGPRDRYHLPNFVRAARKGPVVRLGDGAARFSHVYSENVAHAHVLAADALEPGSVNAGRKYFITDGKPDVNLFDFIVPMLEALGYERSKRSVSFGLAYLAATVTEIFVPKSPFNRFSVTQACVDHTFVHDRATQDFGYQPIVSRDEAFKRTVEWARMAGFAAAPQA